MGIIMKKAREWHSNNKENLLSLKLELNDEETSDVICRVVKTAGIGFTYTNMMTKKSSDNLKDVIREGRRFIMNSEDHFIRGMRVFSFPEIDAFIVVEARLEYGIWKETMRSLLSIHFDSIGKVTTSIIPDICGQVILPNDLSKGFSINNTYVGAYKKAMEFFGGPVFVQSKDGTTFMESASKYGELVYIINFKSSNDFRMLFNIRASGGDSGAGFSFSNEKHSKHFDVVYKKIGILQDKDSMVIKGRNDYFFPELPQKAQENMHAYAKSEIYQHSEDVVGRFQVVEKFMDVCCLQNINGHVWQRNFRVHLNFNNPVTKTEVEFIEITRVLLANGYEIVNMPFKNIPVWVDEDMSGTLFEYSRKMIDEWIYLFTKQSEFGLTGLKKYFKSEHQFGCRHIVSTAQLIGDNNVLEMLLHVECSEKESFLEMLHENIQRIGDSNGYENTDIMLENIFGYMDKSRKKLHQILGIPKGALEYIIDTYGITFLCEIKECFSDTQAGKNYLANMNIDDFKTMLNMITDINSDCVPFSYFLEIFGWLISSRGPANWKLYIEYYAEMLCAHKAVAYHTFVKKIITIGEPARYVEWNPKKDDLKKISESLDEAYLMAVDRDKYGEFVDKFAALHERWSQYEFKNDEFEIHCPKLPTDLVYEGVKLNHCAKEFMQKAADGKTTVLFIRQTNFPREPFFTLEVKNDVIRQCHGANNSCVTKGSSLDKFLHDFCKEKNVGYDIGERLCRA